MSCSAADRIEVTTVPTMSATPAAAESSAGERLRAWRARRRLSQMEVALTAGVSPRHLSFIETGRARASAEVLLALAEVLQMPLRERNALLLAAGFAPRYSQTPLDAPDLAAMRSALARVLDAHDPYPGVALDRHWNIVLANAAAQRMVGVLPPALAQAQPLNIIRIGLHPDGMAAHTANFDEWGGYMLRELQRLAEASLDPVLHSLLDEVQSWPNVAALRTRPSQMPADELIVQCVLLHGTQRLSMFTTLATFGLPRDVTLSELTVELFYPADAATEAALRALA
jgi:transcriptional regulator with XRE-family HTH domain